MRSVAAGTAVAALFPAASHAAADALTSFRRKISGDDAATWRRVRKAFLLKRGLTHLNCGSLGSCPRLVVDGVADFMRELEQDPVHQNWGPMGATAEVVRQNAAAFIGAPAEEVAITRNTTEGMNAVATGLRLEPGDEILTTNHEHPGGISGWEYRAKRDRVRILQIKLPVPATDAKQVVALLEGAITPRTRVCSICHVDTFTGLRLPVRAIADMLHARNILLVCDGAQAPGMLRVNVRELGVDAYASSSHKWMLAPKGSGLLYISKAAADKIAPVSLHAGTSVYSSSSGTRNIPTILGHGLAIDFHNAIGRERVERHGRELSAQLREVLEKIPWLKCISPEPGPLSSSMTSYHLTRGSSGELVEQLRKDFGIVIKRVPGTHVVDGSLKSENYNAVRISTHIFNMEDDLERLERALGEV